jgi:pimeloyl-ACP methyl ester carboxylesterase
MQPRETTVHVEGLSLAVREWPGEGPSLLMIHGLASTSHIWDLVAPRLAPRFRVLAYDQRGHGLSGKPSSGYGFERICADGAQVIRAERLDRPIVIGHSWGANVALELAVRRPRLVAGAVLVDGGFLSMRDRIDWATARQQLAPPDLSGMTLQNFGRAVARATRGTLALTPEIEDVYRSLVRVDPAGFIHPRLSRANHVRILRALWEQDTLALLRRLRVPTLVLAVRPKVTDAPDPRAAGFLREKQRSAAVVRRIGAPLRFAWLEGIHDIPLQRPAVVARRISSFAQDAVG